MRYSRLNSATRCAIAASALALGLAACGGGSSDSSSSSSSSDGGTGSLSLGVTDAPVDSATAVVVEFSSVEFKPAEGESFTIELDPAQSVDLLQQQNGNSQLLIEDEEVPAGDYNWVRLGVNEGVNATYIDFSGTKYPLDVPSGQQSGLKLVSGFSVNDGGTIALTIDFDLRKSVVEAPADNYKLRPALRLVENDQTGEIAVTATDTYISNNLCGSDATDSSQAVYVFEGSGVTPDDVDGSDPEPVTTVQITNEDGDATFTGTAAFLEPGVYTVAFVCDAEDDLPPDPDDNTANDDTLDFRDVVDRRVEAGTTAEYDLPL